MDLVSRGRWLLFIIWFFEGVLVGLGAILPGISGGTLCVVFGMYHPAIETISNINFGIKKHGLMLSVFFIGAALGFIGLSGLAAFLMEREIALVTCAFIGFIIGTFPDLWNESGKKGRNRTSYTALLFCFVLMTVFLTVLKNQSSILVRPGFMTYFVSGVLWGLSFIIPGLSSSSLLLFFDMYKPMLEGIAKFDFLVLVPMAIGMVLSVILLSKLIDIAYKRYYSVISHSVLGITAATAVMLFPQWNGKMNVLIAYIIAIFIGSEISFGLSEICNKLKQTIR